MTVSVNKPPLFGQLGIWLYKESKFSPWNFWAMEIKSSVVLLDGATIAFCTLQWHHRVSDWNLNSSIRYSGVWYEKELEMKVRGWIHCLPVYSVIWEAEVFSKPSILIKFLLPSYQTSTSWGIFFYSLHADNENVFSHLTGNFHHY